MYFTSPFSTLFVLVASVAVCVPVNAENWTRFRGTNGQGISSEKNLPVKWSATKNVAWKSSIPGNAWSSPIVYDDHVFLTTTTDEGKSCRVICINRKDGDIAWDKEVHRQETGAKRAQNSYATPTPITDGKQVYAVFADGTLVAVDFEGELAWKNSDVKFHSLHGLGASPVLAGDQLIMPFDGNSAEDRKIGWKVPWDKAVVQSLDTATGDVRWTGKRGKSRVGHVSPILVDNGAQVVTAGGDRVQAHDVKSGERIWSIYSQGEGVTPSPAVGEGMIFTSSGFEEPTIRAIRMGGKGDVTETHIAWEQKKGVPAIPSFLYVSPYLYTITRDNILHCVEAANGNIVWVKRLQGAYWASPILADGRIYVLSEEGVTLVLCPGPKYDEIARNSLNEKCMASMAVSQGHFYIRTGKRLYCIGPRD
jgi:outer membrane protein assembly factor BamB